MHAPEAGRPIGLLVLQPSPFCNIDCSYCYLAERAVKSSMKIETLSDAFECLFESGRLSARLEVAWHGGEPLVVPLEWYEQAFSIIADLQPADLHIQHRFQTNGLLLSERWIRFFAGTRAKVGLSIDGPAEIHDRHRRRRDGRGTHKDAMRALEMLRDHDVPFHVITVLTDRTLDDADALFEFYVENGIKDVGFNIDEIEGANPTSSLAGAEMEARFRRFIQRFFERVWRSPHLLTLRELEGAIEALGSDSPVFDEQNTPFAIVSIGHDGAMSTFSPELLGASHTRFPGFSFARVGRDAVSAMKDSPLFRVVAGEIEAGVRACETTCPYFRWCGGGAPANKLFETGRFDATATLHCRLSRQIVLDETVARIEGFAEV